MDMHIGRSWPGSDPYIERECPCDQLPCGLVSQQQANQIGCPQHALMSSKTIRSAHAEAECEDVHVSA